MRGGPLPQACIASWRSHERHESHERLDHNELISEVSNAELRQEQLELLLILDCLESDKLGSTWDVFLVDQHRNCWKIFAFPGNRIEFPPLLERQGHLNFVLPSDRLEMHVALGGLGISGDEPEKVAEVLIVVNGPFLRQLPSPSAV